MTQQNEIAHGVFLMIVDKYCIPKLHPLTCELLGTNGLIENVFIRHASSFDLQAYDSKWRMEGNYVVIREVQIHRPENVTGFRYQAKQLEMF